MQFQFVHQRQGGQGRFALHPLNFGRFRLHFSKRQRVAVRGSVAKRTRRVLTLRAGKTSIHRLHQRRGGAEIGLQRIVPPRRGAAGLQVAVDVGTPKTIYRLLGVANQEHGTAGVVALHLVELIKDLVLQGRSVLKLIDHRHRILLQHARAQALGPVWVCAVGAVQCVVQALLHIGKAEAATGALAQQHPCTHPTGGMQTQRHTYWGYRFAGVLQGGEFGKHGG